MTNLQTNQIYHKHFSINTILYIIYIYIVLYIYIYIYVSYINPILYRKNFRHINNRGLNMKQERKQNKNEILKEL